jgi:hypothetical protein
MAFNLRNLAVLAYGNGFTLWHYRAAGETQAAVRADGYFDAAADMLANGDMLMITAGDGGGMACVAVTGDQVRLAALQ